MKNCVAGAGAIVRIAEVPDLGVAFPLLIYHSHGYVQYLDFAVEMICSNIFNYVFI